MSKSHISGFPELLPEERIAENRMIDTIKGIYESYGYTPIETSSVERMDVLLSKGSDDKEIYGIQRYTADSSNSSIADIGLHFDLTIPLARYVAQNKGKLSFPFKRNQIQKCWRGERPQEGRFREFLQADVDVICQGEMQSHYDAEILEIGLRALHEIAPKQFDMYVNNRKLIDGICLSYEINEDDKIFLTSTIDKLKKIGKDKCRELLEERGIPTGCIDIFFKSHSEMHNIDEASKLLATLDQNKLITEGSNELLELATLLQDKLKEYVKLDLCTMRGLDYYTGIIYEAALKTHPNLSICAGGRYDNLSKMIGKEKMPGVGISIGVSRLFALLSQSETLKIDTTTTSKILISAYTEEQRVQCRAIANTIRELGTPCEEAFDFAAKPSKQIQYATRKGIAYVLFVAEDGKMEIKNLNTRAQQAIAINEISTFISDEQ